MSRMGCDAAGPEDRSKDPAVFEKDADQTVVNESGVADAENTRHLDAAALKMMLSNVVNAPVPEE